MLGKYTYLLWLFFFMGVPLLLQLRWWRLFWQQRRAILWTLLGSLVGGWLWDAAAVRFNLWYYEAERIAGIWWFGLPLEEWLWIVGVTLLFANLTVLLVEREKS